MTDIEKMTYDLCDTAKTMAIAAGLGPQEAIAALLTAGIATAFFNMEDGGDLHELATNLVAFVNNACTNVIEGIDNAEKA